MRVTNHVDDPAIQLRILLMSRYWSAFDAFYTEATENSIASFLDLIPLPWRLGDLPMEGLDEAPLDYLAWDLRLSINTHWGTVLYPKRPLLVMSSPTPHGALATAFGPPLVDWEQAVLGLWIECFGVGDWDIMTDAGARFYNVVWGLRHATSHPDRIPVTKAALEALHPWYEYMTDRRCGLKPDSSGASLHIKSAIARAERLRSPMGGLERYRFDVFVELRDIITRHRTRWARGLAAYLRERARADLSAADIVLRQGIDRDLEPSGAVVAAANNWFGGNLDEVCRVLGYRSLRAARMLERRLPWDRFVFLDRLSSELQPYRPDGPSVTEALWRAFCRASARQALWWLHRWETTGRKPTSNDEAKRSLGTGIHVLISARPRETRLVGVLDPMPSVAWGQLTAAAIAAAAHA